jgi:hypothetical protein
MNFRIFVGFIVFYGVFNMITASISLEDQEAGIDSPNRRWWSHRTHLKHPERQIVEAVPVPMPGPMDPTLKPFMSKIHQRVHEHNLKMGHNHTTSFQKRQQRPRRYKICQEPKSEEIDMMNQDVRGYRRHQYRRMRPSKVPTAEHTTEGTAQPYATESMPRQVIEFQDTTRNPLKKRDFKRHHHINQTMPKQTPTDPTNADFELRPIG